MPRSDPFNRVLLGLWVCSLAACAAVPWLTQSATGDLSGVHTDHLRHAFGAWIFLHRGLDIYRLPFGEASLGVAYNHPISAWPLVPAANPIGTFAFFLPIATVGQWVPMGDETFARLGICVLVVVSHLALLAVHQALGPRSAASLLVLASAWLMLVRAALQGFYDPAWVGCAALAIVALRAERPGRALLWLCAAALLNYRALVAAPLGLAAVAELLKASRSRFKPFPWPLLAAALTGAVTLGTFVMVLPYASGFSQMPPLLWSGETPAIAAVLVVTAATAALCAWGADRVVVATVLLTGALALIDPRYWWHGSALLIAPLALDAHRRARQPLACAVGLVAWVWLVQKAAWGGLPNALFRELARAFPG